MTVTPSLESSADAIAASNASGSSEGDGLGDHVTSANSIDRPAAQWMEAEAPVLAPASGQPPAALDDLATVIPDVTVGIRQVRRVKIADLVRADSPRLSGEDPAHTRQLAQLEVALPPIIVHQETMQIIDGVHRVGAALLNGSQEIDAILFDGPLDSAFIIAVAANVVHGLPLSLADRRAAVVKILATHSHWSDRSIARSTGLSARTVRSIRCSTADNAQSNTRLGRDGRMRPLDATAGRHAAAEFLSRHPDSSLREIAKVAGISPGTARDVRNRFRRGESPVQLREDGPRSASPKPRRTPARPDSSPADVSAVLSSLAKDPALRMSNSGRELLRWLHLHVIHSADQAKIVDAAPDHCVANLAELAQRCAANWACIADDLARRAQY